MSSVKDLALENEALKELVSQLQDDNEILTKSNESLLHETHKQKQMINGLKLNNSKLTLERNRLQSEVDRLNHKLQNVTIWDLSDTEQERAGHMLARELLGR